MSEEVKLDWKAERIAEYTRLENDITIEMHEMETDPELLKLMKEQAKLNDMIALLKGTYTKSIEAAQQQQAGIKLELAEKWDIEDKTFECATGTATLRTTKSLHIRDKEKLIHFLNLNKKLTKFIKSFDIANLRKIKDAGMLGDDIATWDKMKNVAIKIAEAEQ